MALINWWMPIVWLAVLVVAAAAGLLVGRTARRRPTASAVPVAHADRLASLPGYRRVVRRYRGLLLATVALVVVLVLSAVALSSRLVSLSVFRPELHDRDIVLCLDASGSMTEYDAALLDTFANLVDSFEGERIGLTIFNASAVTYFPLTTDYDYAKKQMESLRDDMTDPATDYDYTNGTLLGDGSSLIGDGLASCVMRFDDLDEDRSRSIVFATDNYVAGKELITLPEAGEYASSKDVTVYGINPGDTGSQDYIAELAKQMQDAVEATGGKYFTLDDPSTVPSIVESIQEEESGTIYGAPVIVRHDQPVPFIWLSLLGTAAIIVVGWRLRR